MNSIFLIIIILLLSVLLAVVAYNMYQENQYRQRIRNQFGHADDDALLGSNTTSVRDGKSLHATGLRRHPANTQPETPQQDTHAPLDERFVDVVDTTDVTDAVDATTKEIDDIQPVAEMPHEDMVERDLLNELSANDNQPVFTAIDDTPVETTEPPVSTEEPIAEPIQTEINETESVQAAPKSKLKSLFTSLSAKVESEPKAERIVSSEKAAIEPESNHRKLLVELNDLAQSELLWFDKRFDFMGYIALYEPQELHAIPRLSGRHRFQIIGCTMDGRFQAAEPIPGVSYQAFVVGLQAISRNGLAEKGELEYFANQVRQFAQKMDGVSTTADVQTFLEIAQPLDELCARVDQTIAIHLVSRATVLGTEIRTAVEKSGFELMHDGTFSLQDMHGNPKYTIAALDGSAFTEALLSSQPYKGFSMLFDITRVPNAENDFNEFMTLAVRLSGELGLDLVDDQVRQLSTDWLKEVRTYVGARQAEMIKVGIDPGSILAKRLFS